MFNRGGGTAWTLSRGTVFPRGCYVPRRTEAQNRAGIVGTKLAEVRKEMQVPLPLHLAHHLDL